MPSTLDGDRWSSKASFHHRERKGEDRSRAVASRWTRGRGDRSSFVAALRAFTHAPSTWRAISGGAARSPAPCRGGGREPPETRHFPDAASARGGNFETEKKRDSTKLDDKVRPRVTPRRERKTGAAIRRSIGQEATAL
jgi:hypothetical protein